MTRPLTSHTPSIEDGIDTVQSSIVFTIYCSPPPSFFFMTVQFFFPLFVASQRVARGRTVSADFHTALNSPHFFAALPCGPDRGNPYCDGHLRLSPLPSPAPALRPLSPEALSPCPSPSITDWIMRHLSNPSDSECVRFNPACFLLSIRNSPHFPPLSIAPTFSKTAPASSPRVPFRWSKPHRKTHRPSSFIYLRVSNAPRPFPLTYTLSLYTCPPDYQSPGIAFSIRLFIDLSLGYSDDFTHPTPPLHSPMPHFFSSFYHYLVFPPRSACSGPRSRYSAFFWLRCFRLPSLRPTILGLCSEPPHPSLCGFHFFLG